MIKQIYTLFLICLLLGYSISLEAQYLKVKVKTAKIRDIAGINGNVLEKVNKGAFLMIVKEADASTNNYYKVKCNMADCEGWVVRTSVKRIKDEIPDEVFEQYTYATNVLNIGQIPKGYYDAIEDIDGDSLKLKLHQLIRNHKTFTYDEVYSIIGKTDQDPYDTMNVVLLYTGRSMQRQYKDHGGRYEYKMHGYTYQDAWNREHVWPKSFGFNDETDTAFTDLHHIRPADRTIISNRNNRSFDYATEPFYDNNGQVVTECFKSNEWTWEPPDVVKGDIARMVFYMAVRYEGYKVNGNIVHNLEIIDSIPSKGSTEPYLGKLSTLLEWHMKDPVDNWERRRNDIIYKKYQGNRNPFIDHPEYVGRIW